MQRKSCAGAAGGGKGGGGARQNGRERLRIQQPPSLRGETAWICMRGIDSSDSDAESMNGQVKVGYFWEWSGISNRKTRILVGKQGYMREEVGREKEVGREREGGG